MSASQVFHKASSEVFGVYSGAENRGLFTLEQKAEDYLVKKLVRGTSNLQFLVDLYDHLFSHFFRPWNSREPRKRNFVSLGNRTSFITRTEIRKNLHVAPVTVGRFWKAVARHRLVSGVFGVDEYLTSQYWDKVWNHDVLGAINIVVRKAIAEKGAYVLDGSQHSHSGEQSTLSKGHQRRF
ncbi:hypothetical protein BJ742DRAFT_734108 [Cladochytrium replicatum]|nr:hypothetical protein BJ742DRAFT_734108 [Cladochytrium replicatum]